MPLPLPWPFPGDTELDKARRIARDYRAELHRLAPEHCARMDDTCRRLGQPWITPEPMRHQPDDWITIADAAQIVGRTPRAVRYWTAGDPPKLSSITDARGVRRVQVRALLDLERELRQHRASRSA